MAYEYAWENLSGSYYEMGVQHGRENVERMGYLLRAFGVQLDGPWTEADFLKPLEKYLPDLAEEFEGIVAGSGMTRREVVGLSFMVDLGWSGSACTGVLFAGGPDGPVVGKTSDCTPGVQQEWLRPRRIAPKRGFKAVTHSHVGTPNAEMGMNDQGLSIGISGLLSQGYNGQGVGWQQDIRGVLHACATTAEAIDMLRRVPIRKAGYAMVIGDATGDMAVVEKLVGVMGVRRPENNVAYEANVALCPEVISQVNPRWGGPNGPNRMAILDKLVRKEGWSDFSFDGMVSLFSAHGTPTGVCQHGPDLHSQTGFFMLPAKKMLWLARGYTCKRDLEAVRFDF
jgi:predicted choloylglycine hydrolase